MAVGGVSFVKQTGYYSRGKEMGNFELSGLSIVHLLNTQVRHNLIFQKFCRKAMNGEQEIRVSMGQEIAYISEAVPNAD